MYVVLGSYMIIVCAPSVQSCSTLSISTFYCVFFVCQISQIQTCLCVVVGPVFVSTSPEFMRSSTSHPVCPHGRIAQTMGNRAPIARVVGVDTICTAVCDDWSQPELSSQRIP